MGMLDAFGKCDAFFNRLDTKPEATAKLNPTTQPGAESTTAITSRGVNEFGEMECVAQVTEKVTAGREGPNMA